MGACAPRSSSRSSSERARLDSTPAEEFPVDGGYLFDRAPPSMIGGYPTARLRNQVNRQTDLLDSSVGKVGGEICGRVPLACCAAAVHIATAARLREQVGAQECFRGRQREGELMATAFKASAEGRKSVGSTATSIRKCGVSCIMGSATDRIRAQSPRQRSHLRNARAAHMNAPRRITPARHLHDVLRRRNPWKASLGQAPLDEVRLRPARARA